MPLFFYNLLSLSVKDAVYLFFILIYFQANLRLLKKNDCRGTVTSYQRQALVGIMSPQSININQKAYIRIALCNASCTRHILAWIYMYLSL